ncbi:MAG TPA: SDR family oxidoreductase [Accumulibacter sp.]|uniref:D-erythronate dehydrogenase n=1 Tax=Accumulibacter sp. TaxID=2053492 RepID=UPI002630C1AF|nr:D-erythronate dehydrogenase [Accumulibacter sp.]HNK03756.1 SDR family oxidoreductase [Accumulibacter sp.]
MKIVITGGAGFLGWRLARHLLARGHLTDARGKEREIRSIVLVDLVPPAQALADSRLSLACGDISDASFLRQTIDAETASIFHLAAVVSGQAEADFELGMRINLDASRRLLDHCRTFEQAPKFILTSSVAVYGGQLPERVLDTTALCPQSSYGVQKAIAELLVNDYSRRGYVDGRVLRLPTISVRPGKPNQAASSFASGIIREPLLGQPAVCPVSPEMRLWLLSPRQAIASLIVGHELPAAAFAFGRTVNLPGISVRVAEMVAALGRAAGPETTQRIRWQIDPLVERIVGSWPQSWDTVRANALGFVGDANFDSIVRAFIEDELPTSVPGVVK